MKFLKLLLVPLLVLTMTGFAFGQSYFDQSRGSSSIKTNNIDFSGAGVDDITVGGVYTGDRDRCYEVAIDAEGTPDTFQWRPSCSFGSYTTGVSVAASATTLENGITVLWTGTDNHTNTDSWKFKVTAINPLQVRDASGGNMFAVQNDDDIFFLNSTVTSQNAFLGMAMTDAVGTTYLKTNREFVDVANTTTLTAADCGKWLMSDTVGNAKTYTLPGAVAGCKIGFIVGSGGTLTITDFGGDTITCGSDSTGTTLESSTADDFIELLGVGANDWVCIAVGDPDRTAWTWN